LRSSAGLDHGAAFLGAENDIFMPKDKIAPFSPDDAGMEAAIAEAKASIGKFIDAFCRPTARQRSFLVKVVFDEGDQREHIWVADLNFSGNKPSGVIANEPRLPGLKFMQRVEFEPSYISDWMYVDDGYLVGGYTTRVIRDRMSPEARSQFDANIPYRF
jgi:uncharacterized protein YegJ (DUF2314 family)